MCIYIYTNMYYTHSNYIQLRTDFLSNIHCALAIPADMPGQLVQSLGETRSLVLFRAAATSGKFVWAIPRWKKSSAHFFGPVLNRSPWSSWMFLDVLGASLRSGVSFGILHSASMAGRNCEDHLAGGLGLSCREKDLEPREIHQQSIGESWNMGTDALKAQWT